MKEVYKFLIDIHNNNNREWFNAHKERYLRIKERFEKFVMELMGEIYSFDKDINPDLLSVKDCTYRIYRDIRFSKDKTPYKTHMGAYLVKGGKKSPYAGYYFHLEPFADQYGFGNMMCVGAYMPDAKQIASVREEVLVNGETILGAINKAKGFYLDESYSLKKMPTGFESLRDPQLQRIIKLRNYLLVKKVDKEEIFSPNLVKKLASNFKRGYEFNYLINRCIDYAIEEMA